MLGTGDLSLAGSQVSRGSKTETLGFLTSKGVRFGTATWFLLIFDLFCAKNVWILNDAQDSIDHQDSLGLRIPKKLHLDHNIVDP